MWSIEPFLEMADRDGVDREFGDAPYRSNYPAMADRLTGADWPGLARGRIDT